MRPLPRVARIIGASDRIGAAMRRLAGEGTRAVTARPGAIATAIRAKGGQPGREARIASVVAMRRAGRPAAIAAAIARRAPDNAGAVTGSFLDISGGG